MTAAQRARRRRRGNGNGGRGSHGAHQRRALGVFGGIVVLLFALALASAGGAALYGKQRYDAMAADVLPPEQLIAQLPRGGARIYDRNGVFLYEFVDEFGGLRRPVALSEISPHLREATISTEDASFYTNNGLNTRGLARAGIENFSPLNSNFLEGSGGSSITQQLAKNIYIPREERLERSVDRKLKEAVIALELTKRYSKDQILEWYLNSISYGGIYVGIQAAADGYFGKSAKDLSLAEAALLAGIPQSPAQYDPIQNPGAAKERQGYVLDLMVRSGAITPEEAERAKAEELQFKTERKFDIRAPHWVIGPVKQELEARFGTRALYQDGLEVITTIDMGLQEIGEKALEQRISDVDQQSDGHNGALYAVDARTGQVLTYIGSRDYFRDDIEGRNDNIRSLNSPGSTLKPFTYMATFMQGWGTSTQILDSPVSVRDPSTGQNFSPRNPSGNYVGNVSVASALGNSLNVPAFKAILFAGVDNVVNLLKQSGLTSLDQPGGYGPALTLGGVDVRLDDLAFAYTVFPNDGVLRGQQPVVRHEAGEREIDPVVLLKVTNAEGKLLYEFTKPAEKRVVSPAFAYLITNILSDPQNTCLTFNCGGLGMPGRPSAAKTGTSEPYENSRAIGETWTFGYTPDLVAGVWAGNANNAPMGNILSTTISWRAWRDFMVEAHNYLKLPPKNFTRPPGVLDRDTCWPSGRLASELCPTQYRSKGLYAQEAVPRDKLAVDTWWQRVKLDARTGVLATSDTPPGLVYEELRLVIPENELRDYPGLMEMLQQRGAVGLLAPTSAGAPPGAGGGGGGALLSITSPGSGASVSGIVAITGRADSPDFQRYFVEWARGGDAINWNGIQQSSERVSGGSLATWDTRSLPPGPYTVRVRLVDGVRGELQYTVPVVVTGSPGATTSDAAPVAAITSPGQGTAVNGLVQVRGTASSPNFSEATLEVSGAQGGGSNTLAHLNTRVVNGTLGIWNTSGLPDGPYMLRLTVRDGQQPATVSVVLVNVRNSQ